MAGFGSSAFASIGMAVEGGAGNFGGDMLGRQASDETEEERRKRLQAQQQARLTGAGQTALASVYGGNFAAGSPGGAGLGRFGL
jgi:hypothetical protein